MVREWKVLSLITAYHLMIENPLITQFQLLFSCCKVVACIGTLPSYVDGGDFTCYLLWAVPEGGARYWHKKAEEPSSLRRRSNGVRGRRGEREVLLLMDKTPRNAGQVWNWKFIVHAHIFPLA